MIDTLKSASYFGNTLWAYLLFAATAIGGMVFLWILKTIVLSNLSRIAGRTKTKIDDAIIRLVNRFFIPILYFGVVYISANALNLNAAAKKGLDAIGAIFFTYLGIRFLLSLVRFLIFQYWIPKNDNSQNLEVQFRSLMPMITILVWTGGFVFLLSNLGFDVTAIVTGLGIGGVAVAIAGAAILGDLFAYLAIMFDRPFVIGDFLIVGDFLGTVENIGIKTTRIRSLGGELLIFSNKDLTDSRIKNYKRMEQRRVLFKLGVTYDTTVDKLKEIPAIIKSIIEKKANARFDRAHFSSYGDFNLEIEVVYYVLSSDYNKYMDTQQKINFEIKEEFEKRKIEFAFPTQTVHVVKNNE